MSRFAAGCLMMTGLPWIVARLRTSAAHLDAGALSVVAAGPSTEGSSPAATPPDPHDQPPVVRVDEEIRPPDAQPVVTPPVVKAGSGVRRADLGGAPCHDCRCCHVYSQRVHDAHRKIDRLRDELVLADGRRINSYPRQRTTEV